jgi:uncharacterized membrane protein YdfJ with MMPL/SSD domain
MRRSTEIVLRHRRAVLLVWLCLFVAGAAGAAKVGSLLSNQFSVPGSPSQNGLTLLRQKFSQRSDGAFTLVVQSRGGPGSSTSSSTPRCRTPPRRIGHGRSDARSARCPARACT